MDISTAIMLLVGFLISFYLIFNGWMALNENRIYIPFNVKVGLWFANKIYGNEFAKREQDKFIKNQLSQGKQMIIVGVIVLLISLLSVFRF
jgi:uncharacterized membrane protein YiaA